LNSLLPVAPRAGQESLSQLCFARSKSCALKSPNWRQNTREPAQPLPENRPNRSGLQSFSTISSGQLPGLPQLQRRSNHFLLDEPFQRLTVESGQVIKDARAFGKRAHTRTFAQPSPWPITRNGSLCAVQRAFRPTSRVRSMAASQLFPNQTNQPGSSSVLAGPRAQTFLFLRSSRRLKWKQPWAAAESRKTVLMSVAPLSS